MFIELNSQTIQNSSYDTKATQAREGSFWKELTGAQVPKAKAAFPEAGS